MGKICLQTKLATGRLFDLGIYVSPFFYPIVPKGAARIRHTRNDLNQALDAFSQAAKDTGVRA